MGCIIDSVLLSSLISQSRGLFSLWNDCPEGVGSTYIRAPKAHVQGGFEFARNYRASSLTPIIRSRNQNLTGFANCAHLTCVFRTSSVWGQDCGLTTRLWTISLKNGAATVQKLLAWPLSLLQNFCSFQERVHKQSEIANSKILSVWDSYKSG